MYRLFLTGHKINLTPLYFIASTGHIFNKFVMDAACNKYLLAC